MELNQSLFLSLLKDMLKNQLAEAVMFVPQILNEEHADPEPVHKTRVGFRRIRTQLRILKPIAQKKTLRYLRSNSKQIGRKLGQVRDLDILKMSLSTYYALQQPEKDFKKSLWDPIFLDTYEQTYTDMQIILKSQDFIGFLNFFTLFCSTRDYGIKKSVTNIGDNLLNPNEYISNVLIQQASKVGETYALLAKSLDDKMFHRLRIEVKRFRYSLEFFTPMLDEERTLKLLTPLTNIQDHLGAINDFVTSINLVNSILYLKNEEQRPSTYSVINNFKDYIFQEKINYQESFRSLWDSYIQTNPLSLLSDCINY